MATNEGTYIRIWEFQARPGMENEFERIYGPEGDWVRLFRKSKAFLRTDVYRDVETKGHYVTIDYFSSREGFQGLLKEFREAYDALDRLGETICASESRIGNFFTMDGSASH
jgi:quinol monooxygenase YgiN